MKKTSLRFFSGIIFFLGIVTGLSLALISTWGKVESISYFFRGTTYEPFNGLRCPLLMTRSETGTIISVFDNPTTVEDDFFYKVQISQPVTARQIEDRVLVPAGGSKNVEFIVNKDDIDLQFFIFVKMVISPNATRPTREADCGILVLDTSSLTGRQIFAIALALSLLGISIGFILWQSVSAAAGSNMSRIMQALGIAVLLALFAGLMGWWIAGIFLVVITLLLSLMFVRIVLA